MQGYPHPPFFGTPSQTWTRAYAVDDGTIGRLAEALAITRAHALGIRAALHAFAARHAPDGDIAPFAATFIASVLDWPEDPHLVIPTLKTVGILTTDSRIAGWEDTFGLVNRRPVPVAYRTASAAPDGIHRRAPRREWLVGEDHDDRRRRLNAERQRRWRSRHTVTRNALAVTPNGVGVTPKKSAVYMVPARPCDETKIDKHTQPTALRATTETPTTVTTSAPDVTVPEPVAILATIWSGPVTSRIARLVVDRVRDLPRWQRTVDVWHAAGWHVGPGAIRAMLDRYDRDVDGQRQKDAPSRRRPDRPAAQDAPPKATPGSLPVTFVPPQRPPMTDEEFARSRAAFQQAREEFRAKIGAPPSPSRPVGPTTAPTVPARPVPSSFDLVSMPLADRPAALERMLAEVAEAHRMSTAGT